MSWLLGPKYIKHTLRWGSNAAAWRIARDPFLNLVRASFYFSQLKNDVVAVSIDVILVDSNEYVRLIWFKRRIVLPNKIS